MAVTLHNLVRCHKYSTWACCLSTTYPDNAGCSCLWNIIGTTKLQHSCTSQMATVSVFSAIRTYIYLNWCPCYYVHRYEKLVKKMSVTFHNTNRHDTQLHNLVQLLQWQTGYPQHCRSGKFCFTLTHLLTLMLCHQNLMQDQFAMTNHVTHSGGIHFHHTMPIWFQKVMQYQ
jgi:hypothetical protein